MYGPVPTSVPSRVFTAAECVSSSGRTTSNAFARPKSRTFGVPVWRHDDVVGLDVAMDDPPLVRFMEGIGDLHRRARRSAAARGEPAVRRRERLAFHVLHHQVVDVVLVPDVEERADVGMADSRDRLRLPGEPYPKGRVAGKMRGQDLYRDDAIQAGVAGAVHLAHAPGADRREDFVRTEPGSGVDRHAAGARAIMPQNAGRRPRGLRPGA